MIYERASGPRALSGLVHVAVVELRQDQSRNEENNTEGLDDIYGFLVREESTTPFSFFLAARSSKVRRQAGTQQSDIPTQQASWLYGLHRAER